jgi:hypothetical protein
MIPVFRCMVVETLVAQYCGMFSAAGVKRYIRFRELRPLEAWECRQARLNGQVFINGKAIVGKIGATVSHTMFLTGGLDDESRCEVGYMRFLPLAALRRDREQYGQHLNLRTLRSLFT